MLGLQLHHTRDDIYRAGLEGVACSVAQHIAILEEHGLPIRNFMCAGGGTKNEVWLQMIADMTGHEVKIPKESIGACFGDALMAAVGAGYIKGFPELAEYIKVGKSYLPDPEKKAVYQKVQSLYDELYQANRELMHKL